MGFLSAGPTTTTNSSQSTGPSAFAQPYINQQFTGAQTALNQNMQTGPYTGSLYAQTTAPQFAAAQQAQNFGTGAASNLANAGAAGLAGLYGNVPAYSQNAQNLAANGVQGPNSALSGVLNGYGTGQMTANLVSSPLSSALQSAGVQGANSLSGLQGNYSNIANQAMANPTQQITQNAQSYMNAAPVQSAINSTNAQINQTLNDQTLTGLNASEAASGNLNSSRAGMEEALARQGAGIAEGQADSSILNNAYNTGLGTASNLYSNGMNTALNATNGGTSTGLNSALGTANLQNNMGQFNTATQLGAANSGLSNQLGYEGLNANTMLNANSQLGQGVFDASLGTNNVVNAGTSAANLAGTYGALQQANQQGQDTAGYTQFQNTTNYPWQQLSNYANLVDTAGGTQGTGTQTQQQQGSPLGAIMGIASLAAAPFTGGASLMGGMGGLSSLMGGGGGGGGGLMSLLGSATGPNGGGSGLLGNLFGSGAETTSPLASSMPII